MTRAVLWMVTVPTCYLFTGWLVRVGEKGWNADERDLFTVAIYLSIIFATALNEVVRLFGTSPRS